MLGRTFLGCALWATVACDPSRTPVLQASTDLIDFGEVPVGLSATRAVTLSSVGADTVVVRGVDVSAPFKLGSPPVTIPASYAYDLVVTFTPRDESSSETDVVVESNAADAPTLTIKVRGRGAAASTCGPCEAPRAPVCLDQGAALVWAQTGRCDDGACRYDATRRACDAGCDDGAGFCAGEEFVPGPIVGTGCAASSGAVQVSDGSGTSSSPVVLPDGAGGWITTWMNDEGGEDPSLTIDAARASSSLVAGATLEVSAAGSAAHRPHAAASPDGFAIAYSDVGALNRDAYVAILDVDGAFVTRTQLTDDPGASFGVTVAYDDEDDEYGVVFTDTRGLSGGLEDLMLARVTTAGVEIGDEVAITAAPSAKESPSVTWDGDGYSIAWADDRTGNLEIWFARIDATGGSLVADAQLTDAAGASYEPQLVATSSGWAVAFVDDRGGAPHARLVRVDEAGAPVAGSDVVLAAAPAFLPSIAWGDGGLLGAWQSDGAVWMRRFTGDGVALGTPRQVSCADGAGITPHVAFDGERFAIAWADDGAGGGYEIQLVVLP